MIEVSLSRNAYSVHASPRLRATTSIEDTGHNSRHQSGEICIEPTAIGAKGLLKRNPDLQFWQDNSLLGLILSLAVSVAGFANLV